MTTVKQSFNPPLQICKNNCNDFCTVSERKWGIDSDEIFGLKGEKGELEDIRYIGSMQIEEVWKHYYEEYYVSNYGYIVKIKEEDREKAENLIPEELKHADEMSSGCRWAEFSNELKNLFRDNAFIPVNRQNSGCQVCLNITGNTAKYDVHRIVARFFLTKPDDYDENKYVVHHIDNNSYNNQVTNLIYLPANTHTGEQHKIYHPMSHK